MKIFNSKLILFLLIIFVSCFVFYGPIPFILTADLFGHYLYLPMVFDQHSLVLSDLSYPEQINNTYSVSPALYQFVQAESGNYFTKYTSGWAILQAPFYLIAEVWANIAGEKTDGFTYPYQVMIYVGSWFYAMLGLIFTRKVLLHFFTDGMTSLLLFLLVFGTNLFFMFFRSVGQSNIFAFFLVALLIHVIILFYKNPTWKLGFALGLVWGLLVSVRPPDGILGLLIFLWNINSWQDFKNRFRWFTVEKRKLTLSLMVGFLIMLLPQMLYWYSATGSPIINSYSNNNGEGFDFFDPYLFEFLFSFRKGWLVYTPLMLFAFIGAILMIRKNSSGRVMAIVSVLFLYVIASWTCWWYGSGLGSRAAIDMYVICLVFIGVVFNHVHKRELKIVIGIICSFFIFLNLFQTYQISNYILNNSRMTKEYYFSTFLQTTSPTKEQISLLSFDRDRGYSEGFYKNENDYSRTAILEEKFTKTQNLNQANEYAVEYFLPTCEYIKKSHCWIKTTWFYEGDLNSLTKTIFYVTTVHKSGAYGWQGFTIHDQHVYSDTVNQSVSFMYLTPNIRTKKDRLLFGAMNNSQINSGLTARRIEFFEPKVDYE